MRQALLTALEKTIGKSDYLDFMKSFKYPLAGEFSFRRNVLPELRISSDWGIEVGILSEMQRNFSPNNICQVDLADTYDHKHQDLSLDDETKGLSKMSIDIIKTFIKNSLIKSVIEYLLALLLFLTAENAN